jgi:hypothetical protein
VSAATISATLGRVAGLAAHYSDYDDSLTAAASFDEIDLELGSAIIDTDHDGKPRGQLVYAEVTDQDRLQVVGVIDEGDWLDELDEPVFLSGTYEMRGNNVRQDFYVAREAQLLGASLTLEPANLDARPLRSYRGDLRDAGDRRSWPISTASSNPLLGRAIEQCTRELQHRSASRIVDLRERAADWHGLRPGDPVPSGWESRRLPNGLWRSGHAGRILSVR